MTCNISENVHVEDLEISVTLVIKIDIIKGLCNHCKCCKCAIIKKMSKDRTVE